MKSPEEIADEIIETANDATRIVDGAHSCPAGHDDEDVDYFCCGCLRSMIAAAIREAEDRATKAEKAFHALWSVSGDAIKAAKDPERNPWIGEEPWRAHVREMAEIERAGAKIAAAISEQRKRATFTDPIAFDVDAISAERSAGTVPPAPALGDLAHEPSCIHAKNGSTGMIDDRGRCAFCTPTKKENTR